MARLKSACDVSGAAAVSAAPEGAQGRPSQARRPRPRGLEALASLLLVGRANIWFHLRQFGAMPATSCFLYRECASVRTEWPPVWPQAVWASAGGGAVHGGCPEGKARCQGHRCRPLGLLPASSPERREQTARASWEHVCRTGTQFQGWLSPAQGLWLGWVSEEGGFQVLPANCSLSCPPSGMCV